MFGMPVSSNYYRACSPERRKALSHTSDSIRTRFSVGDTARDIGLTTPADVIRRDNILYGPDRKWNTLDVYRPKGAEEKILPVIVSVHGGGWVYGDKDRYQFYCMELCRRGFAVVNFTYRLAPEHVFPAALFDTNAAFAWVLEHAWEYGFDKKNVFATADSAGANYLGLYAAIAVNPEFAEHFSFKVPSGLHFQAITLNSGVYQLTDMASVDSLTQMLMADVFGRTPAKEDLAVISPSLHVAEGYPPVFLTTSNGDFLRNQAPFMAKSLAEHGVPFTYKCYGDKEHDLHHVFMLSIKKPEAGPAIDEQCEFFRHYVSV